MENLVWHKTEGLPNENAHGESGSATPAVLTPHLAVWCRLPLEAVCVEILTTHQVILLRL